MTSLRHHMGALVYDLPRFVMAAHRGRWISMRNRHEHIESNGHGIRCDWQFTSELHIAKVYPSAGTRLMGVALEDWPIGRTEAAPNVSGTPDVSFVIGHRGMARLPHLLECLRSIAASDGVAIECLVIEQSPQSQIHARLPSWVRYEHTPVAADYPYNRAWTLNAGVQLARGPIVVLHDNDMLVPRRYAAELLARVADGARFVDLKRFTFYLHEDQTRRIFDGAALRPAPSVIVQNLRGASIAATREAYREIGGFDEEFLGWGGEDNDFWDRAEAAGGVDDFGYLPFVHLFHAPQPEKLEGREAPAVRRYHDHISEIPPIERIRRLREQRAKPR